MGIYSLTSLLLSALVIIASSWGLASGAAISMRKKAWGALAAVTLGFGGFLIGCAEISGWETYISDAREVASSYVIMMSVAMSTEHLFISIVAFCGLITTIVGIGLYLRRAWSAGQDIHTRLYTLLGLACFSLLSIRSTLTRSDDIHFTGALLPTFFLLTAFLLCYCGALQKRFASIVAWGCIPASVLVPLGDLPPLSVAAAHNLIAFLRADFRAARLVISNEEVKGTLSLTQGLSSSSLFVWPFQSINNVLTEKKSLFYTVQNYSASTKRLENVTVEKMSASPDIPVIFTYNPWHIDGVQNLTRSQLIFRFLLENYETTARRNNTGVMLQRRPASRRFKWQEQLLFAKPLTIFPKQENANLARLAFDQPAPRVSDLIVLRVRSAKTRLGPIGKPGAFIVRFDLSSGKQKLQKFLVPPDGKSHEVLLCPVTTADPKFLRFFSPYPLAPLSAEETIKQINVAWQPLDLLSVPPSKIVIESVAKLIR